MTATGMQQPIQQQQQTQQTTPPLQLKTVITSMEQAMPTTPNSEPTTPTLTSELSEIFYVDNRRKQHVQIQVKLCPEGVYLRRETEQNDHINEQLIRIEDIIGSRFGPRLKKRTRGGLSSCKNPSETAGGDEQPAPNADAGDDTSAYLYIYAYLKKEKPLRRVQTLRILRFRSSNDYASNLHTAELWHQTIRQNKQRVGSGVAAGKQLLILLNPKSGSGKGRELFQKQVAPLLREAEQPYELQITTHPHYAQEFVRTRKDLLERYCGIVVASGDGLFYEVLNGLMERLDWRRACRELPLGIIPCGSGNGLAKSVAHHSNEPYEPKPILHATLTCVAGRATPMDVVRVELARQDKHFVMYSFLSVGWGLIADIDIESERLRSIGAQRFTLWAIRRLITLRSYKGKLYYLPAVTKPKKSVNVTAAASRITVARNSLNEFKDAHDADANVDGISVELRDNAHDDLNDEQFLDAVSMDRSIYRQHADSWHSATSRQTAYYSIDGQSMRSNRSRSLSIAQRIEAANADLEELLPTGAIPALGQELPSSAGWICEDGDFVMVHAAYTTHLASDCFFAPDSRLNDGIIYLVIIRAGVSRSQLFNFLLSMNSGTHLPDNQDPYIRVVPVKAFRIEPTGEDGILTVDGERVDYGAIQAEVFPGMINVMTSTGA